MALIQIREKNQKPPKSEQNSSGLEAYPMGAAET